MISHPAPRTPHSALVVMAGGGTGGHIYPAIAVAEALREAQSSCEIRFVGSRKGLESRVVPEEGWPFFGVSVQGLRGKVWTAWVSGLWQLIQGTCQMWWWFFHWKPVVVFATSGYVSVPAVLAAAALDIPVVWHEQNVAAGWSTKLCARFAGEVLAAFEGLELQVGRSRVTLVGNPLRSKALEGVRIEARLKIGAASATQVVLVTGGSQGSQALNMAVERQWPEWLSASPGIKIVWMTGRGHYESIYHRVFSSKFPGVIMPYDDVMGQWYAAADVAVTRAGALTLSELAVWGLPAVLVPLERSGGGHQGKNAAWFAEHGAVEIVRESEIGRLGAAVTGLLQDPKGYASRCEKMQRLGRRSATSLTASVITRHLAC